MPTTWRKSLSDLWRLGMEPRALSVPAGMPPALVGLLWAGTLDAPDVSLLAASLAILGAYFANLTALVANDLMDETGDTDNPAYVDGFSGGSRLLQNQDWDTHLLKTYAMACALAAASCGAALASVSTPLVLVPAALGLALGIAYSVGPRLVARTLGDAVICVTHGVAPVVFGATAGSGRLLPDSAILGLGVGLVTTGALYGYHVLDAAHDKESAKATLATRLPRRLDPLVCVGEMAVGAAIAIMCVNRRSPAGAYALGAVTAFALAIAIIGWLHPRRENTGPILTGAGVHIVTYGVALVLAAGLQPPAMAAAVCLGIAATGSCGAIPYLRAARHATRPS